MKIFNNVFPSSQRSPRSTPTGVSSNSSIRYKWPSRRKRTKTSKNNSDEHFIGLRQVTSLSTPSEPVGVEPFCPICACEVEVLYQLTRCGHQACLYCWRGFATSQVSSFAMAHITCLACDQRLSRTLILSLLHIPTDPLLVNNYPSLSSPSDAERIYHRYEDFLLHQCLSKDKHTRWCPKGCGFAVLAHGFRACPRLECLHPDCNGAAFCYRCRGPWSSPANESDRGTPPKPQINDTEEKHVCFRKNRSGIDVEANSDRSMFSWIRQIFRLPNLSSTEIAPSVSRAPTPTNYTPVKLNSIPVKRNSTTSDGLIRSMSQRANIRPSSTVAVPDPEANCSSDSADEVQCEVENPSGEADISNIELNLPGESKGQVKPCPRCKTYLLKLDDGSCNHMVCFICGCEFCWLCLREVGGDHYLSPTGCTFWGRQQWPFRRRIYVMLMAAFATPFILALLMAIALPGIVIGFPVYLAYYVFTRSSDENRFKRVTLSSLTFLGGLLFAPVLAGLTAVLGIPLTLIYVYIFMPISLFSTKKSKASKSPKEPEPVDPDIGWNVNWERFADARSHSPNNESVEKASSDSKKNRRKVTSTTSSPDTPHSSTKLFFASDEPIPTASSHNST